MKKLATLTALIALVRLPGCAKPTSNLDAKCPGSRTGPAEYLFEAINLGAATIGKPLPLANN